MRELGSYPREGGNAEKSHPLINASTKKQARRKKRSQSSNFARSFQVHRRVNKKSEPPSYFQYAKIHFDLLFDGFLVTLFRRLFARSSISFCLFRLLAVF